MNEHEGLSFKLTPVVVKTKEFPKAMWGYSTKEVSEFLDMVSKNWEAVQKHEKSLLDEIDRLNEKLAEWEEKEAKIDETRKLANKDAKGIQERATAEAEAYLDEIEEQAKQLRGKTEAWLEKVIDRLEETEVKRKNFLSEFKTSLDHHYKLLEEENELVPPSGSLNYFTEKPSD